MNRRFSRRQVLRVATLGGASSLLAACAAASSSSAGDRPTEPRTAANDPVVAATRMPAPTEPASAPPTPATTAASQIPPTASPAQAGDAQAMATAATQFLATLDDAQRGRATYAFDDAERLRWHWTTPRNFPRNGLPLREMDRSQKDAAYALLEASLSAAGFQKTLDIMSLQNDLGNDPELYYVTIFGTPGAEQAWAWRWEGHHVSRHFTVMGDQIAVTPFFHGAWPTVSGTGLRAMPREEDAGRELIKSLLAAGRREAIFQERTLTQHVTWNRERVSPLSPVGVLVGEFTPDQRALVDEIIRTYLGAQLEPIANDHLARVQQTMDQVRFGWAGGLEPRQPHYYRLQGPTFLLEFDNSRNGATHIHSVWRDYDQDFGYHLG